MKPRNKNTGNRGASPPAAAAPSTTGAAQRLAIIHSTLPARTCVQAADPETKTMQASDVPTAAAVLCAKGSSSVQSNRMMSAGTMTMPPPIPSKPPRKPLTQPTAKHRKVKKIRSTWGKVRRPLPQVQ